MDVIRRISVDRLTNVWSQRSRDFIIVLVIYSATKVIFCRFYRKFLATSKQKSAYAGWDYPFKG